MDDFGDKLLVIIIAICIISGGSFAIHRWSLQREYQHEKIEEKYSYRVQKEVEDTCRAYIASYESYKLTYEQYKDSDRQLEQNWAGSAKMMANDVAVKYNEYILKNSFVWEDNVPKDIKHELEIIK